MMKVVVVVFAVGLFILYNRRGRIDLDLGNLHIDVQKRVLELSGEGSATALRGMVGMNIPQMAPPPVPCSDKTVERNGACVMWTDTSRLSVIRQDSKCYRVTWESLRADHIPMDCFSMKGSHWFGGSEFYSQRLPINSQKIPMQGFWSNDYLFNEHVHVKHGPILEPYWFSSRGVAIYVDDEENPLHVGMNENGDEQLCLAAKSNSAELDVNQKLKLDYLICQAKSTKDIHSFMSEHYIARPSSLPDERVLSSPIWSTWARYKTSINQNSVMEYASEIEKYSFEHSQIEIDDMYTTTYGDFNFDLSKFPDAKQMVDNLHQRGFRITSWMTPFSNYDSHAFHEGVQSDYFVKDSAGIVPGLVRWWQGFGAVIDVTNSKAVDWYVNRLEILRQEIGIDSFKFDSGEVSFLPPHFKTQVPLKNPNEYTTRYANVVARFGGMAEMRAAYRSQDQPFFIRMMDKDSVWGFDNGLRTMIPTALMMSLTGYHYILPDMIGGNGYGDDALHQSTLPSKELFIRWVQLSAYLPSMQFSFTPWQYDDEVIRISKDMVRVHGETVTPAFLRAARDMLKHGTPITRPIWWLDPDDEDALSLDSEFLVGDEILVAPILEDGSRARDIYLPRGLWHDDLRKKRIVGGTWLRDYAVQLDEIATFTHIHDS